MAIGLGAIGTGLSGGMADVYRIYLENSIRQQQVRQAQESDYADFVRRNQYLQGIQAPALARQQAQQELDAFQRTYPQEQIRSNPILQARWAELSQRAGFALPTQAIPETTGIPGQRTAEGGLSQYLTPQGTQQIPTGRTIQQPIIPQTQQRMTLADYDPRFGKTAFGNTFVPLTSTGEVDSAGLTRYYGLAGLQPEAPGAAAGRQRQQKMDYQEFLRGKLLAGMTQPGSVNLPTLRKQMEQSGMSYPAEVAKVKQELKKTEKLPDPSQLTATDRTLFDIFFSADQKKWDALGPESQALLTTRVTEIFRRIGIPLPNKVIPSPDQPWYIKLRDWWRSITTNPPATAPATSVPATPGAPQRGTDLNQFYK